MIQFLKKTKGTQQPKVSIGQSSLEKKEYRKYVAERLKAITSIAQKVAKGNFSQNVIIPKKKDEFTEPLAALGLMVEYLRKFSSEKNRYPEESGQKMMARINELKNRVDESSEARKALINVAEDIEQERGKTAREKSKSQAILASIGDGVIAVDKDRKIIFISRSAEEMSGWKSKEAIGRHASEIFEIEDENRRSIPKEKRPIHLVLSTGQKIATTTNTTAYYFVTKNKERFPAAVTVTPIIFEGKTIGAILVFRDISHEKEVDKAKTEFVSLASHQLRTPLSAIGWYTEMLLAGDAGKINKEQKQYLREIYNGNQRMVALVNSLLNVSRIELGTLAVDPKPTNLVEVAKSLLNELAPEIKEKKLSLKKNFDTSIPIINIDHKLTRMVIQNLLSNAIKYTPEKGKIRIDITKQKSDIIITVADTGYGIPKHQQNKIFSKLFRADNIREKYTEGTGLGLYIVKSVIEQSNGRIWFESEENKGSTFHIAIPLEGMKKKEGTKSLNENNCGVNSQKIK